MPYRLIFYVPDTHLEHVKTALFEIGAGQQGNYDQICWQSLGQGQFRPLSNADPAIGEIGKVAHISEYKVEMLCSADIIHQAVATLKKTHPYEEPAFAVIRLEEI